MTVMTELVSGPCQRLAPLPLGSSPCVGQAQEGQDAVVGKEGTTSHQLRSLGLSLSLLMHTMAAIRPSFPLWSHREEK